MNTDPNVSELWQAQEENEKLRAQVTALADVLRRLCANHPLRSDGIGVGQEASGHETQRLWLDAASKLAALAAEEAAP